LRRGLRQRLEGSPLMDGAAFTRDVEQAYRRMWRKWCADSG
jgi:protein O-GlcNAc transferase